MKFLFLLLFSFLMITVAESQTVYNNSVVMTTSTYNTWLHCEDAGYGKGSFGIITTTTNIKEDDGYYYYDVYLLNNSYYKNGKVASSFIKDIKIYVYYNAEWVNVINFSYALVAPADATFDGYYHLAYVYNYIKVQKIKVTWSEVTPY